MHNKMIIQQLIVILYLFLESTEEVDLIGKTNI